MSEEYTIRCEHCGSVYSDMEAACPYCGHPHPYLDDSDELLPPEAYDEPGLFSAEEYYDEAVQPPYHALPYEDQPYHPDGTAVDEFYGDPENGYLPPEAEAYLEDPYLTDSAVPLTDGVDQQWSPSYGTDYELYDEPAGLEEEPLARRFSRGRMFLGCLGLFVCIGLLYGTVAMFAAYSGLQERATNTQLEAAQHYQRGQEHLSGNDLDLAIAEFQMALSLNPNFLEAREALREAQNVVQAQPTPTSETRSAAAAAILKTAETFIEEEEWFDAIQLLAQVRDLDPDYRSKQVTDLLYEANHELGLQLISSRRIEEAVVSFERAVAERPGDPIASDELDKATLYLEGEKAEQNDEQKAVDTYSLLYSKDPTYLDVEERLANAHARLGDELATDGDWCLAEVQYLEAIDLQASTQVEEKAENSNERCQETATAQVDGTTPTPSSRTTPTRRPTSTISRDSNNSSSNDSASATAGNAAITTGSPVTATLEAGETGAEPTVETAEAAQGGPSSSGSILYSAFNPAEKRWEILTVPAGGGAPKVLVTDATMPAVSPNGQILVYHSELIESEGFHRYNLVTGEDARITLRKYHILPRWGGNNSEFLFVAQEPTTGRWQIHLGFADGKSDPTILRDGRTPDWAPDNSTIAYQGTDSRGNNPGIYLVPFGGGESERLTTHQSDRAPDFSPDGTRLAYMSTQNGSWHIYTINVNGGSPTRITTTPGNHGLPTWSPDGSQIAYVADRGGSWAIYIIDAGGGPPSKVLAWDGLNRADWLLSQIDWTP